MLPDPRLDFQRLKRCVSIHQVLAHFGILEHLRPRGDNLVGVCPIHPGADNPNAFVVNQKWQTWHCFTRCERGGDVIELVRSLRGLSYPQTARLLAQLADVVQQDRRPAPAESSAAPANRQHPFRPYTRRLRLRTEHSFFRRLGLGRDTLQRFQAGYYPLEQGFLARCVAVRLHDLHGRPWGYAGRRLEQQEIRRFGKWKMPTALPKGQMLYNWHRAKDFLPAPLIVTERPWAVMKLWQAGLPAAVALLGLHLSRTQHNILRSMDSPVILLLDGDLPGTTAARRIAGTLDPPPIVVRPGDGVDPDELDEHTLRGLIASTLNNGFSRHSATIRCPHGTGPTGRGDEGVS